MLAEGVKEKDMNLAIEFLEGLDPEAPGTVKGNGKRMGGHGVNSKSIQTNSTPGPLTHCRKPEHTTTLTQGEERSSL